MKGVGPIIAVIVLAIGLLGAIGVVHYSAAASGPQETYQETFDAGTNGTVISFNASKRSGVYYTDTVNVTGENGTRLRPGIDYEWHESNGTLTVLNGDLENDTNATIQYSLRIPSEQTKSFTTLFGQLFNAAYALPLVAAAGLVVAGITALSSLT